MSKDGGYRVGIDIGGTFTDIVLSAPGGARHAYKTLSTPDDYGRGIVAGIKGALDAAAIEPGAIDRVIHATTVATNTILEHKGAKTALITTEGFRDVLEMRRLRIPEMYALNYPKPAPLVPRRLRLEVRERLGPDGSVRLPLDETSVARAIERIAEAGVEAVAVCLIHSYANPTHEVRIAEMLRDALGEGVFVTCSSDILPVIREYERTSTTVINAYLGPALSAYFASLARHLAALKIEAPIQVMKSDGGLMSVAAAARKPAYIVESGPAAGVIGAARLERGQNDLISLDMGGTTAKASIIEGGMVARTGDFEVGSGINLSSKLVMGGGYALKLPVIDLSEIGAGGGSLVSIDAGGLMRVGPESAGADPGPVAYGRGGTQPTFTDALVALGYLNPAHLVGGELALDAEAACAAMNEAVARPLGMDLLDAAYGVFEVACSTMVRAVKAVSTYRGRDPRDFALFAFGGNGPVVGAAIASLLEMRRVLVPLHPGVFSAAGLLASDIEHEIARAFFRRLDGLAAGDLEAAFAELERELAAVMASEGHGAGGFLAERHADLRYAGQAHELTVRLDHGISGDLGAMARAFGDEHERTYGHQAEAEEVECVAIRAVGRVPAELPNGLKPELAKAPAASARRAFFGPEAGHIETPVLGRGDLEGVVMEGPAIIEEYDATCVVPPGWTVRLSEGGALCLEAK
ncbi:MAG TPA: hydantoinase/oxoprolinase family protein [Alphaproteobacteria bacterium]|nr:hydantoinase/oxoprolinase family protein [Alphaproteobacteria bacterium]